jgi:integrase
VKKKNGDPFSSQTMLHFRNALSAMFRLADDLGFLPGANPASKVRCPRLVRKPRRILTLEEAYKLLAALPTPTREAAKLSMITGLNVAEMFGLNRECVNLRAEPVLTQDGVIPGYCAAIRRNYFRQVLDTVKTAARRRIVPLTPGLVAMLRELMATSKRQEPDAPVFQTPSGTRLDANNQAGRVLRPIAKLVLKRGVGWHEFRHAAATSSELVEMPLSERTALLGHAQAAMTNYYTDADLARRRPYLERMELLIEAAGKAEEGRQVS